MNSGCIKKLEMLLKKLDDYVFFLELAWMVHQWQIFVYQKQQKIKCVAYKTAFKLRAVLLVDHSLSLENVKDPSSNPGIC